MQLCQLTSLRDAAAAFKFPIFEERLTEFHSEDVRRKREARRKRMHVEVWALQSISAREEPKQRFQTKGVVKEKLD